MPGARARGVALLRDHELRWHKVAKDGSGKCDIVEVRSPSSLVFGVLCEIPDDEKASLDRAEGLGQGYEEKEVALELADRRVAALAYVATNIRPDILPYSWYKALVVAGAIEHGLPTDYLRVLRAVRAAQDADAARHAKHMALAGDA